MAHLCCSCSSLMIPGKPGQFNLRWVAFLSCIFSIFALPSISFSLCVRARSVWKIVTFIDSLDCKYFRRASSAWNPQSVVRGGKWLEILKISSFHFFSSLEVLSLYWGELSIKPLLSRGGHRLRAGLWEYPRPRDAKDVGTGEKILQVRCFKDWCGTWKDAFLFCETEGTKDKI